MPKLHNKTCIACGATFTSRNSNALNCSDRCNWANCRERFKALHGIDRATAQRAVHRKNGLCGCGRQRSANKKTCFECRERTKESNHTRRIMILLAYGGKCVCCGEHRLGLLSIDHVNNDGAQHRKDLGGRSSFYLHRFLIKHGFPKEGFRVLCYNCNLGRYFNGGLCPHEEER